MQSGAMRFQVEEAYRLAAAELLRDFRAAAERLRLAEASANDNLRAPAVPQDGPAG